MSHRPIDGLACHVTHASCCENVCVEMSLLLASCAANKTCCAPKLISMLAAVVVLQLCCLVEGSDLVYLNYMEHTLADVASSIIKWLIQQGLLQHNRGNVCCCRPGGPIRHSPRAVL